MQKLELQWKQISIDLETVDAKLRADHPDTYKGNQAAGILELWFSELPDQAAQDAIVAYWEALDASSPEALSYRSQTQITAAIQTLKEGIPAKTWNQMSALERRLQMGLAVSKADLIAAQVL